MHQADGRKKSLIAKRELQKSASTEKEVSTIMTTTSSAIDEGSQALEETATKLE